MARPNPCGDGNFYVSKNKNIKTYLLKYEKVYDGESNTRLL